MKKISLVAFLAMLVLFTGCSQKTVENTAEETQKVEDSSESSLNKVDEMGQQIVEVGEIADDLTDLKGKSNIFIVNGKPVYIKSIYFDFDKYTLNDEQRAIAKANAAKLAAYTGTIKIEGNCDEWGTDEYNYALGLKRAKAVKSALVADGLNADSISLVSFGEANPKCSDKSQECWKDNRRAEYKPLP